MRKAEKKIENVVKTVEIFEKMWYNITNENKEIFLNVQFQINF